MAVLAGLLAARALRLSAGDERRQPIDVAAVVCGCCCRGAAAAAAVADWETAAPRAADRAAARACRRLGLARRGRLAMRLLVAGVGGAVLFAVLERVVAHVAAHVGLGAIVELRILLAELFLRSGDQAIVVLGVLIIVLGRHRVAGRLRVTGKLDVFLGDVRRSSADLDVGSVGLENPRHRVLILVAVDCECCDAVLLLRPRIRLLF